jgi:hypothetical protein
VHPNILKVMIYSMMIVVIIHLEEVTFPVFVSLKDVNDDTQNHIERLLQSISPGKKLREEIFFLYVMAWMSIDLKRVN